MLTNVQFTLAVALIIGTLFMNSQMNFLLDKNLGFNDDQVIQITAPWKEGREIMESLRSGLRNDTNVKRVSGSWNSLGSNRNDFQALPTNSGDKKVRAFGFEADPTLPDLLQLHISKGRTFQKDADLKSAKEVLVNQELVKAYGWKHPIGKHISKMYRFEHAEVVGVVKDFHFQSMHRKIGPLVISPSFYIPMIYVRLQGGSINGSLNRVGEAWNTVAPGLPFDFTFLDDQIQRRYQAEQRWTRIVQAASIIAITIACMGLFGLAALASAKREKEISVRKVLGATVVSLIGLLSKDFLKPVLAGLILAVPLAYLSMSWWLQDFAYRIELGPETFIWAVALTVGIAAATISWQSIRTALTNPAKSLRTE